MILEQSDRMALGWSREWLARASGVDVASVYLLERMGTAGPEDDARIQNALSRGKVGRVLRHVEPVANSSGAQAGPQHATDTSPGSSKAIKGWSMTSGEAAAVQAGASAADGAVAWFITLRDADKDCRY